LEVDTKTFKKLILSRMSYA